MAFTSVNEWKHKWFSPFSTYCRREVWGGWDYNFVIIHNSGILCEALRAAPRYVLAKLECSKQTDG